jgi:hypothetical protein
MTTTTLRIERVEFERRAADGMISDHDELIVWPYWSGNVDRPEGYGYAFADDARGRALAQRLKAAMLAQVVFTDAHVLRDINGKTYIDAHSRVLGRKANADLRRLGF